MNPLTRRTFLKTTALATIAAATAPTIAETKARYKLIGFTKPFQDLNADECADTVEQIGWDGIECPLRAKGQIEPERAADELPKLIEALNKRGKTIDLLATDIVSATQPHAETTLRLASKHGITRYRLGFWKYKTEKSI